MKDEVHIWRIDLAKPGNSELLSADEQDRANRFRFATHRNRYISGRATLRTILARFAERAPEQLIFEYTQFGKPFLPDSKIRFNLSHSEDLAVLAITFEREIGVDVERIRQQKDILDVAERYFSGPEREALRSLPGSDRAAGFYRCWTRKEAYIKARGDGLSLDLNSFVVSLLPQEPAALLAANDGPEEISRWRMFTLDLHPQYAAALAVEDRDGRVRLRQEELAA